MEWPFERIASACDKVLNEEKHGSKERLILAEVTKLLRAHLLTSSKDTKATSKATNKAPKAPASSATEKARAVADVSTSTIGQNNPSGAPLGTDISKATATAAATDATGTVATPLTEMAPPPPHPLQAKLPGGDAVTGQQCDNKSGPVVALSKVEQFVTNEDLLNQLYYICRVVIVGDADTNVTGNNSSSGNSGRGTARPPTRLLIAALELAALVLDCGIVPIEMVAAPPVYEFSRESSSGALVFFSKLLGSSSGTAATTVRLAPPPTSTLADTHTASADGSAGPPQVDTAPKHNVRLALVDAVLSMREAVWAKESNENLWFAFIAALGAAAVPRVSRASSSYITAAQMRTNQLSVHGARLAKVLEILLSVLSPRNTISPLLHEEAKTTINRIAKALPKFIEDERHISEDNRPADIEQASRPTAGPSTVDLPALKMEAPTALHGLDDAVSVIEFCSTVIRNAPLSSTVTERSSAAANTTTITNNSNNDAAVCATSTLQDNFPALVVSLGVVLQLIVNGGPTFRTTLVVVRCIRLALIPAAIRAALSTDLDVFRLSLNLLLTCCFRFPAQLVNETSAIFRHVYFRVLDSTFTTLVQKSLVMEVFRQYIEEPQHLIGLFLNYDCNTYSHSIYEEMIGYLSALATPPTSATNNTGSKHGAAAATESSAISPMTSVVIAYTVPEALRRDALLTLLLVSESHIQWIERFETDRVDSIPPTESTAAGAGPEGADDTADTSGATEEDTGELHLEHQQSMSLQQASGPLPLPASSSLSSSSAGWNSNEVFMQARRYKDAFRKFLHLFNEKAKPDAAIEFLQSSVLITVPKTSDTRSVEPTPAMEPAPSSVVVSPDDAALAGIPATKGTAGSDEAEAEARAVGRTVAVFLRDADEYIDKVVLGDYFAKCLRSVKSRMVFGEWIGLHNFSGMTLDAALREFLGGFKLLGEAQVVDRTMELFAAQYCLQNPSTFTSADTAFILSFSICMLNTDAHNTHVKEKMTLDGFISNNRGIDEGNDLDPALLKGIYDRITREEIVLRKSSKYMSRISSATKLPKKPTSGILSSSVLESIPLLRHLAPRAIVVTDKVELPGDTLTLSQLKRREHYYQDELRVALQEVMESLQAPGAPAAQLIMATSFENALPLWEVTVDVMCHQLVASLQFLFEQSESYVDPNNPPTHAAASATASGGAGAAVGTTAPPAGGATAASGGAKSEAQLAVSAYMRDTVNSSYYESVLRGVTNTVRVCCSFGNVSHTEVLLGKLFQMTQLSQAVVISTSPVPHIAITHVIPRTRLMLLSAYLNLYVRYGATFTARGWQAGYAAVSLLDALANGIEGMWRRRNKTLLRNSPSTANAAAAQQSTESTTSPATAVAATQAPPDLWFGTLRDVPRSIERASVLRRQAILGTLRGVPSGAVDLWLDRLFDITEYPFDTRVHMASGLVKVCERELQCNRTFSLTKLFDLMAICASSTSRLQWRELWANASAVFIMAAGKTDLIIANSSLDGLRLIALTYLMREELLNYSFQKEMLRPFEAILMSNQDLRIRTRVIDIVAELSNFHAGHLASGWSVVFACLSHAAMIPELCQQAWDVCEGVMRQHLESIRDYFGSLIFSLTTFASTSGQSQIALCGLSYLVACAHWLQYGLQPPPRDVKGAAAVVRWAGRFRTAEQEARASAGMGRSLTHVTLATDPLTSLNPLEKPQHVLGKTRYHLWMSVLEGMAPVVVAHPTTRVRAHALCCLWALVRQYGSAFASEVQDALFSGTLRPITEALLFHPAIAEEEAGLEGTSGGGGGSEKGGTDSPRFDQLDHRILVYVALKGMLLSCCDVPHLLELACQTLEDLMIGSPQMPAPLLTDIADVFLCACRDFLEAAVERGEESAPASPASPPLITGLQHELQQIGVVDVLRYKRTAGWTELHHTPVATTRAVRLAAPLRVYSLVSLVRHTVLRCLSDGLIAQILYAMRMSIGDRDVCLSLARTLRRAMLMLAWYFISTRDTEGLVLLLDVTDAGDANATEGGEGLCYPIEYLLTLPYMWALLEFTFFVTEEINEACKGLVEERYASFIAAMKDSREFCVQRQHELYTAAMQRAADAPTTEDGRRIAPYKGQGFVDVFKSCRGSLSKRHKLTPGDSTSAARRRSWAEWVYLMHLIGLQCTFMLPPSASTFASIVPTDTLLQTIAILPSAMEETSSDDFFLSCWEELDLHCSKPTDSMMTLSMWLLQDRVRS